MDGFSPIEYSFKTIDRSPIPQSICFGKPEWPRLLTLSLRETHRFHRCGSSAPSFTEQEVFVDAFFK